MSGRPAARRILTGAAVFLGCVGLAFLFAPDEAGRFLGLLPLPAGVPAGPGLELFGAALTGFALLDWAGRGAIYGGIYGRPIALANLLLGFAAGLTLLREGAGLRAALLAWAFLALAGAFAWLVFGARPWDGDQEPGA